MMLSNPWLRYIECSPEADLLFFKPPLPQHSLGLSRTLGFRTGLRGYMPTGRKITYVCTAVTLLLYSLLKVWSVG